MKKILIQSINPFHIFVRPVCCIYLKMSATTSVTYYRHNYTNNAVKAVLHTKTKNENK